MTKQEKAIREFCGHHANWWPSTTQVQEMLALAQLEQYPQIAISPEIVGYVAPKCTWVGLTNKEFAEILCDDRWQGRPELMMLQVQAKLKENNT